MGIDQQNIAAGKKRKAKIKYSDGEKQTGGTQIQ